MYYISIGFILYAVAIVLFYRSLLKKYDHRILYTPNVPEEYQPFVRYDRINWSELEIYLCAIFILPFRLVFIFLSLMACYLVLAIGSTGNLQSRILFNLGVQLDKPWPLQRYTIVKQAVNLLATFYMFFSGFHIIPRRIVKYSDFDPSYVQTEEDKHRRPSIIVSNHFSWYDSIYYVSQFMPSFLSKETVQYYPIFGRITTALKSVYLKRDSADDRNQVMSKIKERARLIEDGQVFPPIIIFPEGTTSNGRYLLSFKKGAFEPLLSIKVCCLKYSDSRFNLGLDTIGILAVASLSVVQLCNRMELIEFEGVYNPKHLNLEQYPEEERWHIYAERVKDMMAKCLGKKKSESGFRQGQQYEKEYIRGKEKRQ